MFIGYNTNGFAHHRLEDAINILAELGYRGVALTVDCHHCDPLAPGFVTRLRTLGERLNTLGLARVIETGARFLLDPRRKHQPTLMDEDQERRNVRLHFLLDCIKAAGKEGLSAEVVSFWSGAAPEGLSGKKMMSRLVEACRRLADEAAHQQVRLAFEPEPGMFIDTMDKFAELYERVDHPAFGLTLDIGHLVCQRELPVSEYLCKWREVVWNIHIEDMKPNVHDHLFFGEGEVDFVDVFGALREIGYAQGVYVELSRHSYDAVNIARRAKTFLDRYLLEVLD